MASLNETTIKDILDRIISAACPDRIIMFGSHARGDARPDSDIDLAVIVSGPIHRRKTAQKIYMSLIGAGHPVDVTVLTPEDLITYANSPGMIIPEILSEGKELYAA